MKELDWNKLEKVYGKSQPEEISNPLKKSKFLFSETKRIRPVTPPMAMLVCTDGKIKHYENAKEGVWEYEGSDGVLKKTMLNHKFMKDNMWGEQSVKTYIVDENAQFPHSCHPILYSEEFNDVVDKVLANEENYRAKNMARKEQFSGIGEMLKKFFVGIAILLGVIFLAMLVGVDVIGFFKALLESDAKTQVSGEIIRNLSNG